MTATRTPQQTSKATFVVLVADKLDPDGVTILEEAGLEARVQQGLSPDELKAAVADVDGILVRSASKITGEIIASAPKLKAIGRAGIGVDNIDIPAASQRGVLVMNTPLANATTTAELAIAHLFGLARPLARAQQSMAEGKWEKSKLVGAEVTGKTLLVVGLGKIGRIVADRALGLRMDVLAYDPYLTGDCPVKGVRLVDLEQGLAAADFVTLHLPKSADTLGLFGAETLAGMKPGACLINCARGGIVVEADLLAALEKGHLAGAALDVFESEPLPEDSPLRSAPNVRLTPHLGASSAEAQKRVSTEIAKQMADYLLRGEARCAVNAPTVSAEELAVLRPFLHLARNASAMLSQTAEGPVVRVEIAYCGELAERDTDALRLEVLSGLLSPHLETPVNAVNAEAIATEHGLRVFEERDRQPGDYTTLLKVKAFTKDGTRHGLAGTVYRDRPRVVLFDGFDVDLVPEGTLLLTRHVDAPGVLGQVASWLGQRHVNIGGLHMAAATAPDQTALALYELDRALTREELDELATLPPIASARTLVV